MAIPVVPTEIIEEASRLSPPPPVQRLVIGDDVCVIVVLGICAAGAIAICYANSKPITCSIGGSGGLSRGGSGWGRPDCWAKWLIDMAMNDAEYAADLVDVALGNISWATANANFVHRAAGAAARYASCIAGGGSGIPGGGSLPGRPRGIGTWFDW